MINWFSISNSIPNSVCYKQRMCSSWQFHVFKKIPIEIIMIFVPNLEFFKKYMHHNSIFTYKNSIAWLQSCWNISQFANISLFVPKWNKTKNERKKNCPSIYKSFKIYISIQIYGSHGNMLLYDKTIILHSSEYITILRAIFLNALFYKIFFWSTTTNLTDKLLAPQVKLSGRGLARLSPAYH
jgi:hypothetical protein